MGFFIVRGLSSILEAVLWTYFIIVLAKIFTKDDSNPIIQAFLTRKPVFLDNAEFLKLSYFKNTHTNKSRK